MIKGLSDRRRLPRAGKIKLGVMVIPQGGGKPYPRATDHFVCPENVQKVFGDKPTVLRIMFPTDDTRELFPQELKMYRKGAGLFCAGDGETARRWTDQGELAERTCPCEYLEGDQPQCKPTAVLNFLLPEVKGLGVWQLSMHGKVAIVSINSALDHFTATFGGLRGIPFLLKLEQEETQRFDEKTKSMVRTTIRVPRLDSTSSYLDVFEYRKAIGGKVEIMGMLPAAPEDADDAPDDEAGEALYQSQAAGTPAAPAPTTAPTTDQIGVEGWTIEACYRAAKAFGLTATEYGNFLYIIYGTGSDLTAPQINEQAQMFEKAEAGGKVARDVLVQTIKLKGKKG